MTALPTNKSNPKPLADSDIVSVFRIRADECDRLWMLDTGVADVWGNYDVVAPPAIVIFDLKTDRLIKRFVIPEENIKDTTFFANIVSTTTHSDSVYVFFIYLCSANPFYCHCLSSPRSGFNTC